MQEFGIERLMRDAKLLTIGGGTSQIQQLIIIRELMKG
jgi:alkylation response protein AidB-like acyl-CoA dehydrogenase